MCGGGGGSEARARKRASDDVQETGPADGLRGGFRGGGGSESNRKQCQRRTARCRRHASTIARVHAAPHTHLHDGGQPDGAVPEDGRALVGAAEIPAPPDHRHAAIGRQFPGAYLVPEEGEDIGGRPDPPDAGVGEGPSEGGRFGEEAVPCFFVFAFPVVSEERPDAFDVCHALVIGT